MDSNITLNLGQYQTTQKMVNRIDELTRIKAAGEARQVLNDLFDRNIIRQGVYEREMTRVAEALGLKLKED